MTGGRVVAAALATAGALAAALALADVTGGVVGTVRAVVTLAFLLVGPGWAMTAALRPHSLAERLVVAVGASVALGVLIGQLMVVTTWWHPTVALLAVIAVTGLVLLGQALRAPVPVGGATA